MKLAEANYPFERTTHRYLLRISGIVLGFLFVSAMQFQIDQIKDGHEKIEELAALPKGEYLRPFLLGYQQLAADILWLRVIQVNGDKVVSAKGYDWIFHALDVVTTLDPKFSYAYQFGGVNLSVSGGEVEKSNALLLKGAKENPDVWQIPFYLGFNHFFFMHDYQTAADFMAQASSIPGHPDYLPQLASRLYAQSGKEETAIQFLERMVQETEDEKVREALRKRIEQIREGKVKGIFGNAGRK